MLMRLCKYNLVAEHVPGKDLVVADALSRTPTDVSKKLDDALSDDVEAYVASVEESWPVR
jgi:ethanolamine utilization microcompartment shell protein EutS